MSSKLDQLRSNTNRGYQAKITSETVTAAIRDKYRHKIKQLEGEQNNLLEMKNNINMLFYNMNMYPQMYENTLLADFVKNNSEKFNFMDIGNNEGVDNEGIDEDGGIYNSTSMDMDENFGVNTLNNHGKMNMANISNINNEMNMTNMNDEMNIMNYLMTLSNMNNNNQGVNLANDINSIGANINSDMQNFNSVNNIANGTISDNNQMNNNCNMNNFTDMNELTNMFNLLNVNKNLIANNNMNINNPANQVQTKLTLTKTSNANSLNMSNNSVNTGKMSPLRKGSSNIVSKNKNISHQAPVFNIKNNNNNVCFNLKNAKNMNSCKNDFNAVDNLLNMD